MTNPYEDEVDFADDDEVISALAGTGSTCSPSLFAINYISDDYFIFL
jgi:hypothetical protein